MAYPGTYAQGPGQGAAVPPPQPGGGLQAQLGGFSASGSPATQFSPLSPGFGGGGGIGQWLGGFGGAPSQGGPMGPNQFHGAQGGVQGLGAHAQQMLAQGRTPGQFAGGGMPQLGGAPQISAVSQGPGMSPGMMEQWSHVPGYGQLSQAPPSPQIASLQQAMSGAGASGAPQGPTNAYLQAMQGAKGNMQMDQQRYSHGGMVNTAATRPGGQMGAPQPGGPVGSVRSPGMAGMRPGRGSASGGGIAMAPGAPGAGGPSVGAQQAGPQVGADAGFNAQIRKPFGNSQFRRGALARGAAVQGMR